MAEENHISYITEKGLIRYAFSIPKIWYLMALSLFSTCITISIPFLLVFIMSQIWFVDNTLTYLEIAGLILTICLVQFYISYLKESIYYDTELDINTSVATESLDLITSLPYTYSGNLPIETKYNQYLPFRNFIATWVNDIIKPLLETPLVIISFSIICLLLGFMYFAFLCLIIIIMTFVSKKMLANNKPDKSVSDAILYGTINDTISNLSLIKEHNKVKFFYYKIINIVEKKLLHTFSSTTKNSFYEIINEAMLMILYIGTLSISLFSLLNGTLEITNLITIILLIWFSMGSCKVLIDTINKLPQINDTIKHLTLSKNATNTIHRHKKISINDQFQGKITLKSVSLNFSNNSGFILSNINFTLKRGEVLLINGPSGAGKSVILKIIAGLYKPLSGFVSIDVDRSVSDEKTLTNKVALITRYSYLDNETIIGNLQLSHDKLPETEMNYYLNKLNISKGINSNIANKYKLKDFENIKSKKISYEKIINKLVLSKINTDIKGKVILIDELILEDFEDESDFEYFAKVINHIKPYNTIIICSRYNFYWKLADKVILIQEGKVQKYFKRNK